MRIPALTFLLAFGSVLPKLNPPSLDKVFAKGLADVIPAPTPKPGLFIAPKPPCCCGVATLPKAGVPLELAANKGAPELKLVLLEVPKEALPKDPKGFWTGGVGLATLVTPPNPVKAEDCELFPNPKEGADPPVGAPDDIDPNGPGTVVAGLLKLVLVPNIPAVEDAPRVVLENVEGCPNWNVELDAVVPKAGKADPNKSF